MGVENSNSRQKALKQNFLNANAGEEFQFLVNYINSSLKNKSALYPIIPVYLISCFLSKLLSLFQ